MGTLTRRAPTGEIVNSGVVVTSMPLVASNTLMAGWQNPESVAVLAKVLVHFTTAGTGTLDAGTGTGGTGAANNVLIDGGTMAAGVITSNNALGSAGTLGGGDWWPIAANGAAGDTITVNSNELATGTYAGRAYIHYHISG